MTYSVVAAQPSDAYDIATICLDSFKNDPILSRLWADIDPEANHAWHVRRFTRNFEDAERDGTRFMKEVDDGDGKILAFAKWRYPHTLTAEQKSAKESAEQNEEPRPAGTNAELSQIFTNALEERRKEYIDENEEYFLHLLCVLTSHQRQGLGSMLIRQGLAIADEHDAKTYIEASPAGLRLYLRYGWRQVDDIVIDLRPHGGDCVASEKCLLRLPRGEGEEGGGF